MLSISSYPIIWVVVFGAAAIGLSGFGYLISTTAKSMSATEQAFARSIRIGLVVWLVLANVYALVVGLNFVSFIPVLAIPLLIGTYLMFQPTPTAVLRCVPLHLLILLGSYRVAGGIFVYAHNQHDLLSQGFATNAGWGDVLTGVLAPFVAYVVYKNLGFAYAAVVVWTCIGIGDLIVAPISANIFGAERLVDFPLNLIPLFLGPPFGILLHCVTLRAAWLQRDADVVEPQSG